MWSLVLMLVWLTTGGIDSETRTTGLYASYPECLTALADKAIREAARPALVLPSGDYRVVEIMLSCVGPVQQDT